MRLIPLRFIRKAVNASSKKYKVFYFHPYELDTKDMQIGHKTASASSMFSLFQQILGRNGNPGKIEQLLKENRFSDFSSLPLFAKRACNE